MKQRVNYVFRNRHCCYSNNHYHRRSRWFATSSFLLWVYCCICIFNFQRLLVVSANNSNNNNNNNKNNANRNNNNNNNNANRNNNNNNYNIKSSESSSFKTASSQQPPPPPPPPPPSSSSSATTSTSGVVQVVESEIWDAVDNEWKAGGFGAAGKQRWTDENGNPSASPLDREPPKGFQFVGDWKIVVQTGRDSMGWEYQFRYLQQPSRRRIWLRSLEKIVKEDDDEDDISSTSIITSRERQRRQRQQISKRKRQRPTLSVISTLLQRIHDNYNFKGYGLSLYKSFLFRESFGIALRLPLTMNFDWWDSHPELPNFVSSICMFHPFVIGLWLSGSINVEWLKWIVLRGYLTCRKAILFVLYSVLLRSIVLTINVLLYPFSKTVYTLPTLQLSTIPSNRPNFRADLSERLGMSLSYRYSKSRGYEWRISYWYLYLPTLLAYRNSIDSFVESWIDPYRTTIRSMFDPVISKWNNKIINNNNSKQSKKRNEDSQNNKSKQYYNNDRRTTAETVTSNTDNSSSSSSNTAVAVAAGGNSESSSLGWWHKHFAALGLSSACPMPNPPGFSCSAVLSLSGFYLRKLGGINTNIQNVLSNNDEDHNDKVVSEELLQSSSSSSKTTTTATTRTKASSSALKDDEEYGDTTITSPWNQVASSSQQQQQQQDQQYQRVQVAATKKTKTM